MKLELDSIVARHPAARDGAVPALKGLSLSVGRGEQVAIIGPSGAGKTTLLQILACALRPVSGRFDADGASPWGLQRLRGRLLLAPQVPPLPPRQRVVTAVLAARLPAMGLWASLRSLFYPADIPAAFDALEHFDLGDKIFERVDRLSGGERQRVGLARALIAPAELWLIDEPLSALDPTRARQAMESLTAAARARSVTLISTLHQVDAALAHFPRIIGLRDGQIAFDLPSSEVSQALLERLYEQHEDELHGKSAPTIDHALSSSPQPAVMHCR